MADKFVDDDYTPPTRGGNYMKLKQGENRFRILAPSIHGFKGWATDGDGKMKPVRRRMDDFENGEVDRDTVRAFLAFPVWNHDAKAVQVLELSQSTIIERIVGLARNKKWGPPYSYDIVITRSGEGLGTKYEVTPEPKEPLDDNAVTVWKSVKPDFDLARLFSSGDPFGKQTAVHPVGGDESDPLPF
jgi:hypothetical protein